MSRGLVEHAAVAAVEGGVAAAGHGAGGAEPGRAQAAGALQRYPMPGRGAREDIQLHRPRVRLRTSHTGTRAKRQKPGMPRAHRPEPAAAQGAHYNGTGRRMHSGADWYWYHRHPAADDRTGGIRQDNRDSLPDPDGHDPAVIGRRQQDIARLCRRAIALHDGHMRNWRVRDRDLARGTISAAKWSYRADGNC